jgi:hypothetical protein
LIRRGIGDFARHDQSVRGKHKASAGGDAQRGRFDEQFVMGARSGTAAALSVTCQGNRAEDACRWIVRARDDLGSETSTAKAGEQFAPHRAVG